MLLRLGEFGISVLSILTGAAFWLGSLQFPGPAGEGDLGPAFFPRVLSIILIALGSTQAVKTLLYNRSNAVLPKSQLFKVLGGMLFCTLYIYLIPVCGYFYATALMCPVLLVYQGYRKIPWIVAVTLCFLAMSYLVFYRFLAVSLPV